MMDDLTYGFIEEVRDLLLQMEEDLIRLEKDPKNLEIINGIFRVMHTLKGSAGMAGFKNIQDFTHEFETLYDQIRMGKITVDSSIIDVTLKARDNMLFMLENNDFEADSNELLHTIYDKYNSSGKPDGSKNTSGILISDHLYVILFSPEKGIFERGLNPDKTLEELKSTGQTYIISHEKKKTWEAQKIEKKCHTVWEIYVRTSQSISEIKDIFLFYLEDEFQVFEISHEQLEIDPFLSDKLARLYKNKILPKEQIKSGIDQLPPPVISHVVPVQNNIINTDSESSGTRQSEESTINVSSHKLDELMNLVSELVTLTATMELHATRFNDARLHNTVEQIEKLTKRFRNNALDLRLVPVGSLLMKFKRQIRDLSKELGKKVNLLIEGQDIEIDKTILKSIESPLQHIIRNSIDHGLESESERIAKGKPSEGLLKISAFYSGASVIIQVQDDGAGINLDRVRECAIKKGFLQADQNASKQDLIGLIMEPGFTTNDNITIVSGRGVGMDVVRKELNGVGGSLEVFTEKDLGTSVVMKLPTTLTILDTLMIHIDQTQILIPVMDIEYCFKEKTEILFGKDNRYVEYKNNPIPLVSLREQFGFESLKNEEAMVIVINKFDRRYAVIADEIVGEHQAVIKPLGALFVNQPFFSGGSIMVDGKLAFILDSNFIFNQITKI